MKLEARNRDEGSAATSRTDKMRGRSKYLFFVLFFQETLQVTPKRANTKNQQRI